MKSWQKAISFIFEMVNTFRDLVSFTWHWKEEKIKKKHWMLNLFWSRKTIAGMSEGGAGGGQLPPQIFRLCCILALNTFLLQSSFRTRARILKPLNAFPYMHGKFLAWDFTTLAHNRPQRKPKVHFDVFMPRWNDKSRSIPKKCCNSLVGEN